MYYESLRYKRALNIHALTPKALAIKEETPIFIKTPQIKLSHTADKIKKEFEDLME
jgi:hypothetical protein